jgi:hypothetical protein
MRKIDLGTQGDNLFEYQGYQSAYSTEYHLQIFGEDRKAVLIFSDTRQNYSNDELRPLENKSQMTGVVRDVLDKCDYRDLYQIEVIYHRPENVVGDNSETFQKVNYYFDGNGLHETFSNSREDLSPQQVAEKIGPENFVEQQFAYTRIFNFENGEQPDYGRVNLASQELDASPHLQDIANQHQWHNPHEYEQQQF